MQPVLNKILYLAALQFLDKHLIVFYQGGLFKEDKPIVFIRETILDLCEQLKNEAISLIDAIAPPDFVLNSVLGDSTGDAYKKLYNSMIQSTDSMQKIKYLDEFLTKPVIKSNL